MWRCGHSAQASFFTAADFESSSYASLLGITGVLLDKEQGMATKFEGGIDIALKLPPHQFEATVAFYRDVIGLKQITEKGADVGFEFGPVKLWIDIAPEMSQAEIWLELFTDDFTKAAKHLGDAGVIRCDAIEPLPEGFRGGWITNPANIIHMVREPDAW